MARSTPRPADETPDVPDAPGPAAGTTSGTTPDVEATPDAAPEPTEPTEPAEPTGVPDEGPEPAGDPAGEETEARADGEDGPADLPTDLDGAEPPERPATEDLPAELPAGRDDTPADEDRTTDGPTPEEPSAGAVTVDPAGAPATPTPDEPTPDEPEPDAPSSAAAEPGPAEPAAPPAPVPHAPGTHDTPARHAVVPGAEPTTSAWRRLGDSLRPRLTRSQVLAGVLCAVLGFAIVVQVQQSSTDRLSALRQDDLVRLLDEVTQRSEQLESEVNRLETSRDELRSGSGQAQAAVDLAEQRAATEGILSGRLPAQGPGIEIEISEGSGRLEGSDLFNVLEELRNAGAEAMEVNGVRLVTSSYFADRDGRIVVDGTPVASPYRWTVIGDPSTLDRALEIPGGALATVRTKGAQATTTQHDQVEVTSVKELADPQFATPTTSDDSGG